MKSNIIYLAVLLLIISGCKKEEELISNTTQNIPFTPTVMTCIKGILLDNNQNPISGAIVTIDGYTANTNDRGLFTFNDISSSNRPVIHFEKDGYFKTSRGLNISSDVSNYLRVVMDQKILSTTFDASQGINYTDNNITLDLPGGSYTDNWGNTYYGNINVYVNPISTNSSNFTMRIPGGDLSATDQNGDDVRLVSFGMLDVVLTNEWDEPVNMSSQATISFPIANDMLNDAPATIPLWHYDENSGLWIEEGYADKVGNFYVGNVSHFSNWNFDQPGQEAGLEGRVVDCEGNPIANIQVIAGQQNTSTDTDGEFALYIPPNQNITLEIITNFGDTISQSISPVSPNTAYDAGDISACVNVSVIEGTITDCNGNPAQNVFVYSDYSYFTYAYSDINGNFSMLFPANTSTTIYAEGFFGTTSPGTAISSLANNQVFNAGTIIMCEGTGATSVAQDKQNISNSFASMENCITNLKNGYGAQALKNFLNLDEGEVLSEDWIDDMIDNMENFINIDDIDDNNRFDFNSNTGTYTWNQAMQNWTHSNSPINNIVIRFPSTETTQNNDAIFTFHSYNDIMLFYDGENIWAPEDLQADLYINGTKVFEVNAALSYDVNNSTPIPINVNTSIEFNPFTISVIGQKIGNTNKFEADMIISNTSGCSTTLHVDVDFAHNDWENLEETDIIEVNMDMSHGNMLIDGYMDGDLMGYDDPSNNQIDAMTDVDVFYAGNKIGELKLQKNSNDEERVYIIYSDGSSEDTDVYYDPFANNIEQILFPFIGSWD